LAYLQKTRWPHFSSQRTIISGGQKLFRGLISDNFISSSIKGPCTHREVVMQIVKHSDKPLKLESIPKELGSCILPRGNILFGNPGDCLERIARNYPDMHWWMSDIGLNLGTVPNVSPNISQFDSFAGRLVCEARSKRQLSHRFLPGAIHGIAKMVDKKNFSLLPLLVGGARRELAVWNQKHPNQTIHTFVAAVKSEAPGIRSGAKRRLYLAGDRYMKARPDLSCTEVRTIA
jgi:hypothetical protein